MRNCGARDFTDTEYAVYLGWKIIDKARTSGRNEEAGEEIPQLVEWSPAEHKWKRELLFELPKEGAKHQAECAERMKVLIGKGGAKKFQTRMRESPYYGSAGV